MQPRQPCVSRPVPPRHWLPQVPSSQRGDLLVFVAGSADIAQLCAALAPYAEETRR
jgi:hypothetical protein